MAGLTYQVGKRGVPILSHEKIDGDAEYLISQYDNTLLTDPRAIDVDDFVERYLGFNLHFENLSFNGCIWGRMVFNNRRILVYVPETHGIAYHPIDANTIVVDNSLLEDNSEFAYRSTVIHEAGHGLYHPQIFKEDDNQISLFPVKNADKKAVTVCRSVDVLGVKNEGRRELITDHDWIEHHAKYFSAAVLMPKKAMQIVCGDMRTREHCKRFGPLADEMLAQRVSGVFNVSPTSARIRIKQLGYAFQQEENQQNMFTDGVFERMSV